jgi:membrane-associated phospholipid phosphatase
MCAITRLYDNKHHVTDIVAGMALGVVMGYYVVGFIPTEMFQ